MKYEWNEGLYQQIISDIKQNTSFCLKNKIFNIQNLPYRKKMRQVTEVYFVHPDGPYKGTKAELKKDTAYKTKNLLKKEQTVDFWGDAIQQAIDDAAAAGGGRVVIPEGIYYTGALRMKSGVDLHLEKDAVVRFIRNKENTYYPMVFTRWEGVECMNFSPFIYAMEAENIAISGKGTLDGGADEYNWMPWKFGYFGEADQEVLRQQLFSLAETTEPVECARVFSDEVSTLRPPFLQFYKSRNIRIEGVRIIHSPFWEINPVLCENIDVCDITIETDLYNNDGVDPESCRNVWIRNSFFLTGDDCIAIKSGRNGDGRRIGIPSENIIIEDNHFKNGHGGVTIGSEISGGVKNVFAQNNYFNSQQLDYPIRFKTNAQRGGVLENVYVRNCQVEKAKIAVVHADFFYEEGENGAHRPVLRNITLENITTAGDGIASEQPLYLKGFTDSPIQNITLSHVVLDGVKGDSVLQNLTGLCLEDVWINGVRQKDMTVSADDFGQLHTESGRNG